MSVTTLIRYECDWCAAHQEMTKEGQSGASLKALGAWTQWKLDGEPYDLCPRCAEALRELVVRRGGSLPHTGTHPQSETNPPIARTAGGLRYPPEFKAASETKASPYPPYDR
jgi:hypothetical protein